MAKVASELVFHLFLAMLHDAGVVDDPNLDPSHARRAMRDTIAFIDSVAAQNGISSDLGNVVLTNGRSMVGICLRDSMHVRLLKQQTDPRRPESEYKAVLLVSGHDGSGEGFEELPPNQAVAINRDVSTDIAAIDA